MATKRVSERLAPSLAAFSLTTSPYSSDGCVRCVQSLLQSLPRLRISIANPTHSGPMRSSTQRTRQLLPERPRSLNRRSSSAKKVYIGAFARFPLHQTCPYFAPTTDCCCITKAAPCCGAVPQVNIKEEALSCS